jgi:hypothetical protein
VTDPPTFRPAIIGPVSLTSQHLSNVYGGDSSLLNFIRYGTKWIDRIGNLKQQANINLNNPTEHPDLATYLKSLPGWYQCLLNIFRQVETDLAIWRRIPV